MRHLTPFYRSSPSPESCRSFGEGQKLAQIQFEWQEVVQAFTLAVEPERSAREICLAQVLPRESVIKNQKQLDFVQIIKGMSISSLASGDNFLELGLSKIYNLRLQAGKDGDITASLISTLNSGEMPPVRKELISDDERVTAELLERRIHALRQVYAMSLLLGDDREKELYNRLLENPHADLEAELVSTEGKLLFQEAGPGSLILTVIAKSKRTYQAVLNACALPYAEGRNALLRRVQADTALKELSVEDKSLDIKLKKAHGIVDVLKKIDSIKDKDERDEIRRSFMGNLSDFSKPGSPLTIKAETQSQPAIPAEQPAKRPAKITKATPARLNYPLIPDAQTIR